MQQLPKYELSDIIAFVALAETGSFVQAARRLGRDPTILSRRLRTLEAELGVRLAERTTRRVALTEAGRDYLLRVRPLLAGLESAHRETSALADGEPRGRLRLTLPGSFGRMWLAPLLVEFLAEYPSVTIEAEFSNRFVDIVSEGFDAAVRLGSMSDSRLIITKVADRRRLLCAAPGYIGRFGEPTSPKDLAAHHCLIFTGRPRPEIWEFAAPDGTDMAVAVSGPLASDEAEVLVTAGVKGLGVVYAADWLVGRELADGSLIPLLENWRLPDEGAIYTVVPSNVGLPSKTRAFVDWIGSRLRNRPPWRRPSVP